MTTTEVRAIFRDVYNGDTNLMTPDVLRYGNKGDLVYEISSGEFGPDTLFGVTVLERNGTGWHRSKHSKMCESRGEAEAYVSSWTMHKGVTTV